MRARPCRPVRRRVDEVPGRQGKGVEVLEEGPRRRAADGLRAVEAGPAVEREAAHGVEGRRGVGRPERGELGHRVLGFAEDHGIGAGREVCSGVVGRVGAVHGHAAPARPGGGGHRESRLAAARRAHLRQEVEVVLENADDPRARGVERPHELALAFGKHRVEEHDVETARPEDGRREERRERRIGLHLSQLLRVVREEVGVGEEDLRPGRHVRRD
jgi:hypothetical protein